MNYEDEKDNGINDYRQFFFLTKDYRQC